MRARVLYCCAGALLTACAQEHKRDSHARKLDSGTNSAEVSGSIHGSSLSIRDARFGLSNLYLAELVATTGPHFEIALSDHSQPCGSPRAPGQILLIDLFDDPSASDSRVTQPGDYEVWTLPEGPGNSTPPMDQRSVTTWSAQADGMETLRLARSGKVVVTAVSEEELSGTFDLTFSDGELAGSFSASFCDDWQLSAIIPGPASR